MILVALLFSAACVLAGAPSAFVFPSKNIMPVVEESVGNQLNFQIGWQWFLGNFQLRNIRTQEKLRAGVQIGFIYNTEVAGEISSQYYEGQHSLTLVYNESGRPSTYSIVSQILYPPQVTYNTNPMLVEFRASATASASFRAVSSVLAGNAGALYTANATFLDQYNASVAIDFTVVDRQGTLFQDTNGYIYPHYPWYWFCFPDLQVTEGRVVYGNDAYDIIAEDSLGRIGFQYTSGPVIHVHWDWYPLQITEVDGVPLKKAIVSHVYHTRNSTSGAVLNQYSFGSYLKDGKTVPLNASTDFTFDIIEFSSNGWPSVARIVIFPLGLNVTATNIIDGAVFDDLYMEIGADVVGTMNGRSVKGYTYSEHTGY